ncbi:MAG: G1 family glutamic endopeptidase [Jatrophihabitans sp.]|uniref:G1 family glutamic endopeptidase n=1 Tax=Jatrophihabitans sp. TaxID=1932789 RepID=UPI003F7E536A
MSPLVRPLRPLLLLAAAAVPLLAAPPAAASAHHVLADHRIVRFHHGHAGTRAHSLNWAGYIRTGHGFTHVAASWRVPTLARTAAGYSSTWIGIDGATASDQFLIQTGTEADLTHGRRIYRAWWEVITPTDVAPEVLFPTLTIHPGDSISASVTRLASGRWTMRLRDDTTKVSASHTVGFAGPGRTAEWIQEDTAVDNAISTAPDWGVVTFRHCRLNRANPSLLPREAVDLVDRQGTREVATGNPTARGDGFSVTWLAGGVPAALG